MNRIYKDVKIIEKIGSKCLDFEKKEVRVLVL